jgi:HK97 family phage major capsid protein
VNTRLKHLGWLLLAALFLLAVGAHAADIQLQQTFGLDVVGSAGLMLANAVVGIPVQDQIKLYEAKLAELQSKAEALMKKSVDEARSLDEKEAEEYDQLEADIVEAQKHIDRLKKHEKLMLTKATTVDPEKAGRESAGAGAGSGVEVRGNVLAVRPNVEKGIAFTRFALAMVRAKGNIQSALQMAKNTGGWKDTTPQVLNCLEFAANMGDARLLIEKAAVAAGTTSHATWAGPLVQYQDMVSEFVEYLRPQTILGKLNLRRVPFNIRLARQTGGSTGGFVGEGLPKPVNALAFDNITLGWFKAAVIVVLTDEVVRFSNPSVEALARQDMAEGIAAFLDTRFIDPSYAGVANVSPASITNGLTARQSTGITVAAITADVKAMIGGMVAANLMPTKWIMSPVTALALSMIRDTNDEFVFPDINIGGGKWFGLPVVTSNSVASSGSPNEKQVVLISEPEILLADDGEIAIDMSMEASLQMNDAPSAGATSLVSLWQNNMVGLRAERYINWRARRTGAVALLENLAL